MRTFRDNFIPAVIGTFLAMLVYWAFDRNDPVLIKEAHLEGDFVPGGDVRFVWKARAWRDCEGEARRRLITENGLTLEYDPIPTVIRPDGELNEDRPYQRIFTLPALLAPGMYQHSVVVRYWCNPLQRVLNWPIVPKRSTISFKVEAPKNGRN